MGLFDTFRRKFFTPTGLANPWTIPNDISTSGLFKAYGKTYSLFAISLRIAMTVGEVNWELFKKKADGSKKEIYEHPVLELLNNPNPFQTGAEMIEFTQLNLDISGKAFWWIPKNRLGVPGEIWVIPSTMISPVPSKQNFIEGFVLQSGSETIPLSTDEVVWFKMPDLNNPWEGVGYADAASIEIQSEDASGRWNRNFFSNSARPDGVLEYEKRLTTEEFSRLSEAWRQQHQGVGRSHKVAILEGGVKWKQIQSSVKDMDFPNLRKITRENIMFTFGIPQSVMGISENVNRANAEAGEYTFARWLIHPRLVKIRDKINQKLMPLFHTGGRVKVDFAEVVPETIDQQRLNAESAIRSGYATVNEARAISPLNLEPLTSSIGDDLLVPLNLIPTGTTKGSTSTVSKGALITGETRRQRFWLDTVAKWAETEQVLLDRIRIFFEKQRDEALEKFRDSDGKARNLIDTRLAEKTLFYILEQPLTELILRTQQDGILLINPPVENRNVKKEAVAELAAIAWLTTKLKITAKEVNQTTKDSLGLALATGFDKGEGIPALATRIETVFEEAIGKDSISRGRAFMIARTETSQAASEGALRGYTESGVVKRAQFLSAGEDDWDCDCPGLDGTEFPLSKASGIIPVHPNCRCTWIPVV